MGKKISDLAVAATLTGSEMIELEQEGVSVHATAAQVAALGGGGGSGTLPGTAYAKLQCALLEPDAIEPLLTDTFTYAVGAQTKYVLASWATQINAGGRAEVRDPHLPLALTNTSFNGSQINACAVVLNPATPTYADPWTTYYTRKNAIDTADVKTINLSGGSQHIPFLPGPYGCIVTQVTCFDLCWVIIRVADTYGFNTANEISDAAIQRIGNNLCLPISKRVAGEFESSSTGSGTGSLSFVLLPATWSAVADPISSSYTFRDDFMGNALDTSANWTRVQSATGNVEIDLTYHWCKLFGNGTWGANGLYAKTGYARTALKAMVLDVFGPRGATGGAAMVGWSDGLGQSYANFAHAVNFAGSSAINIYENGTNRGTVGSGWTNGGIYRVRITVTSTGAKYEIQGGKEYPPIGSATWTNITPATTASSTATLYPGATAFGANSYISDVRVY